MITPGDHEDTTAFPDAEARGELEAGQGLPSPKGVSRRTWMIIGVWMVVVAAFFILVGYLGAHNF
ncbi:MAG: hypothetical protein WA751_04095 [Candidatus Dormiibacterota bacterium]